MTKTIYLIRHGQTYFNQYHKIQGWVDSPLTELGINQAKQAGKMVKEMGIQFTEAYSSTSERACDTLELVTNNQIPYKRLKGLKEMSFGEFEAHDESLNPSLPYGDFFVRFGGESTEQAGNRVFSTIDAIVQKADEDSRILFVSHNGAIREFLTKAIGDNNVPPHVPNCTLVVLDYKNGKYEFKKMIEPKER